MVVLQQIAKQKLIKTSAHSRDKTFKTYGVIKMSVINSIDLKSKGIRIGQLVLHCVLILSCLLVILPLVLIFIVSISSEYSVLKNGYSLFPTEYSLKAYSLIFSNRLIFNAYGVSIFVTVVGTCISVLCMSMIAYTLSNSKCKYRNALALFLYFPTLINPGLIPWYINITENLHLQNTIWALILPSLIGPYNIFLIRNYYKTIPESLMESAQIDGASQFRIFFKIVMPLALPITATISLFVSLGFWNDWYLAAWFIDEQKLYPLQFFLYNLTANLTSNYGSDVPSQTFYVAMMFVTIGPIILVYPFLQKYFVKGIVVGAVKG